MKKLNLIFLLIGSISIATAAPIEVHQFDNAQQEADFQSLIQELRCPQCQNNNIADSNATISTDMREKTLELLKQGKSKQDVVDYMIERYGNFVTYNPPLTTATVILWLLPALLILAGFGLIWRRKKSLQTVDFSDSFVKSGENAQKVTPQLSSAEQERLNKILDKDNE